MKPLTIIALLIVFKTILLLVPLAMIWAINALFGTEIGYTFLNWLAVFVLVVGVKVLFSLKVEVTRS